LDYLSQVVNAAKRGNAIPPEPQWNKWLHRNMSENHCPECLKLHECWFAKEKTPKWPHHEYCHCILESVSYGVVVAIAVADSAYSKFDPYLFNTTGSYTHGKEKLFELWGYSVDDIPWLKAEIEQQALEKYLSGDYILGKLDRNGQRINIRIAIERRDTGEIVTFLSGWMARPNGQLQMTTPYGDD